MADQETAPLLRDPDGGQTNGGTNPTFVDRVASVAHEPLTALSKVLLILVVVLLLLSSVFIGLFAGVAHKLHLERDKHDGGDTPYYTITVTATSIGTETATDTLTATATTTAITTAITTATSISTTAATSIGTVTTTAIGTITTTATTTEVVTRTIIPAPVPTGPDAEKTCLTSDCIVLSASILSSLDTSQDPCENFYDFANGGWLKSHPLPADKGSFGTFNALAQQNQEIIRSILESDFSPSSHSSLSIPSAEWSYDDILLAKLRGLYSSCMDEELLNEKGTKPLADLVQTIHRLYKNDLLSMRTQEGLADFVEARPSGLTAAVSFMHSRGIPALFSFEIEGDAGKDPNRMTLWFSQPSFGLPSKEYYEEASIRALFQDVIERLITALSDDFDDLQEANNVDGVSDWPPWPWPPWGDDDDGERGERNARQLARKVVSFESQLAKASLDLDKLFQDPLGTYNPLPLSNLTKTIPQIQFSDYFSVFTPRTFPDQVIITYPAYAASLSKVLEETSSDVIEAYLVIRAALSLSPYLGMKTEAWQAVRSLDETLKGIQKGAVGERSEYCVGKVESALGFAAGRYFVNETFAGESREKGTKVITDIVHSFKASLPCIEWMDDESAHAAAQKADAIRVKVGFPLSPDTRSAVSLARYYGSVRIDREEFFENMLSASASDVSKMWAMLGRKRDPETWEMYPSMVNAYFNPPANEIVFPAGILQPPFFSKDWPGYMSYGSFGQVAAHELTHAFDSAGRLYNQEGKLEQWWTNATSDGFQVLQDCIIKQYSEYTVDDGKGGRIHVNGNLTSGENIGDTGIIQAYRAWKEQYDDSFDAGHEYVLPGLNFTREQLFFISFARAWAQNIKPASAVQRIRTDPHSPNRFRVDGTLSNVPEFAKAFECSKGTKLNPPRAKQCLFW